MVWAESASLKFIEFQERCPNLSWSASEPLVQATTPYTIHARPAPRMPAGARFQTFRRPVPTPSAVACSRPSIGVCDLARARSTAKRPPTPMCYRSEAWGSSLLGIVCLLDHAAGSYLLSEAHPWAIPQRADYTCLPVPEVQSGESESSRNERFDRQLLPLLRMEPWFLCAQD